MRPPPTDPAKYGPVKAVSPPVVAAEVRDLLPRAAGRYALGAVHQLEDSHREREVGWVHMLGPAVELAKFRAEVRTYVAHALLHRFQVAGAEHLMPVPGRKPKRNSIAASVSITISGDIPEYLENVQLRYNYRLDPQPRHRPRSGRRSAARGWCSTTVWRRGTKRTRPDSGTSPTRSCRRG